VLLGTRECIEDETGRSRDVLSRFGISAQSLGALTPRVTKVTSEGHTCTFAFVEPFMTDDSTRDNALDGVSRDGTRDRADSPVELGGLDWLI